MGRIQKNYLYNLIYQIIVILSPIVTAPYLSRVVGAEHLGIYSFVNSSGNIILTISLLGIYSYGCRQIAYVRDQKPVLSRTFWEIMLARVPLGIVGTLFYAGYIYFNTDQARYLMLYYPFLLANFLDCSWVFVGLEDMLPAVLKNGAVKLLTVIGIFVLVKKAEDIWIYILLIAAATLAGNLLVYLQLPKHVGFSKCRFRDAMAHLRGSLHLFLPQVASLFYLQVDKVMLKWLTGTTAQVSYYDQAEKIITIPLTVITVMSTVMMPRIANEFRKGKQAEIERLLLRAGRFALFLAFPMMAGLFAVARQFVPWYLGAAFLPTAYAMMILSPIVVLNSLTGISGSQYFTATDQIKVLLRSYVSASVLNVVVNAILIPRMGYGGAAIATVLSAMISTLIQYLTLSRQIRLKRLFLCGLRYLLTALIMGAILVFTTGSMPARFSTTLLQIGLGIAVTCAEMALIRDETMMELLGAFRSRLRRKNSEI